MGYLSVWKVLDEMIADFRNKNINVPSEIVDYLKTARTMLRIQRASESCGESLQKIDEFLSKVEAYLISEGQERFGPEYADRWLKRIYEAGREDLEEDEEKTEFISGVPRELKRIRVKPTTELPTERIRTLAKESSLSCITQTEDRIIIYGKEERIKDFIKKMAEESHARKTK